jgi:effector-binding domain-containing protein
MIDTPEILHTDLRLTATIHLTIPRSEMQKVMGPGIQELLSTLKAQGVEPLGRWFAHHFKMSPDVFDFEIGVPVGTAVKEVGRVKNGSLAATRVARTIYRGPYQGLGDAWGQLEKWIAESGHTSSPSLWETYLTDPSDGSDPSTWQTELTRPLID